MAKHRKAATNHVNPLLGGALVAGGLLLAAAPIASADTGVNGRPDSGPAAQPGVDAIQKAGDKVLDSDPTIPGFLGGGPISLNGTDAGQLYHALYGYSTAGAKLASDDPDSVTEGSQGLTLGVVNSFTTNYKVRCNIVVQTRCGGPA